MNYYFYLLVFLIPFLILSPLQKVMGVPGGFIYAGLASFLILGLLIEKPERLKLRKILRTPLITPLILFFGATLISFANTVIRTGMKGVQADNLMEIGYLAFAIVFYWAAVTFIDEREKLIASIKAFAVGAVTASLYGLVRMFLAMVGSQYGSYYDWTVPRLAATAGEPQVFGGFIISVLPIFVAVMLYKIRGFGVTPSRLVVLTLLLALVLTYSAGAWAGFGLALVVLAACFTYYNFKSVLSVAVIFSLVALSLVLVDKTIYPHYFEAFSSIGYKIIGKVPPPEKFEGKGTYETLAEYSLPSPDSKDAKYLQSLRSKVERSWFRTALWEMFKSSPVLGVGPGNFGPLYRQFRPPGSEDPPYIPKPHNQYLEVLAETGIVGALAFGLVLIKLFLHILSAWLKASGENRKILAGLVASLLAVGVHGYSFGILVHLQVWLLLAITMALAAIIDKTAGGRCY